MAIEPEERPIYVWTVTSADGCETTVYDAATGSTDAGFANPGCGRPPTPRSNVERTELATDSTTTTTTTPPPSNRDPTTVEPSTSTASGQPGFGAVVAVLGLLCAVWVAVRR